MKTFVGLFFTSTGFGLAILIAYWFIGHEETTGTVLLAIMTSALAFAATYAVIAERNARLDGDGEKLTPEDTKGEDLGIFTTQSAYPILVALSVLFMLLGILYSPLLAFVAIVALLLCLWRLGAESARI
ncbi:MAG: cytochrome c oxidase subunit 4 [Candidatus Eremiobacteraeota bacterium]|nr:cytochrome c oxidase subunit 4 [Candidatus Eremiobacteraeota bacterium]